MTNKSTPDKQVLEGIFVVIALSKVKLFIYCKFLFIYCKYFYRKTVACNVVSVFSELLNESETQLELKKKLRSNSLFDCKEASLKRTYIVFTVEAQ